MNILFSRSNTRSKCVRLSTTFSIFFLLLTNTLRADVGLRLQPYHLPLTPLVLSQNLVRQEPKSILAVPLDRIPVQYPKMITHSTVFDSTGKYVFITRRLDGLDIQLPRRYFFQEYLDARSQQEFRMQWRQLVYANVTTERAAQRRGRGLTIESPKIKSEAFQRIFGGETLSLRVTGNITIDGSMRNEKRSQVKTAVNRSANTNFQMKQTQRFKVTGKIGENVSIDVDQDSERPFEFENAIHLAYSSDEDGIIESIEAGNVSLSLPGTRFVTVSGQNAGLFGVKSKFKVGALDVTAIASMEKGEKNKLSITGGKEDQAYEIQDYDYKKGTYFFLDQSYREDYQKNYNAEQRVPTIIGYNKYITDIELFISDYNYDSKPDARQMWAIINPDNPSDTLTASQESIKGYFVRLEPTDDYYINRDLGYIAMNNSLRESEILAVAYRDSSGHQYGALDTTGNIIKLIKPRNARPSDETWDLEWKNVYSLGGRDIDKEGFKLKLYYKTPSGDPQDAIKIGDETKGYLEVFALDKFDQYGNPPPDNLIDFHPNIINFSRGEIIFPNLRPFDPDENDPFPFPKEMESKRTRAVYDTLNSAYIRQQSKFYFEVTSSRRNPNLQLGINVIPNSEEVRLNGVVLQKGTDYVIDYDFGQLTLLREDATNPDANLEVNYERQQLFAMDKKSIAGARAEYTLFENGNNRSFIGATMLYLNQKTLDRRVRVGQGPMRNLVWDVNTQLRFEPNFLTKALDALPILSASAPSTFNFEGEIAQILPNPNTLNNEKTGDDNGVAYLDDFEGSRRQISLGVIRSGWHPASPPTISADDSIAAYMATRGYLMWVNPYRQVAIKEIWPDREVTTNFGGTTRVHVLQLRFEPNTTLAKADRTKSWGGVQTALSAGYADQTDSRFIEIWVKGNEGRLNIDLGTISEDAIPNKALNTEDKLRDGFRNDILDDDEDTGIDGVKGSDPPDPFYPHEEAVIENGVATPYDFWDLNGDKIKEENEPWSYDNWSYTTGEEESKYFLHVNGTENNKSDGLAIYPNTEDLNKNGDVDLTNDYYEFSFSLDKNSPDAAKITGGKDNEYGWRKYQLPLNDPTKIIGEPDWSRIESVRIWIDGVEDTATATIAEINMVGNEWKLRGVVFENFETDTILVDAENDSIMSVSVINTHDNPDEYTPPPGVEGEIDPIQKIQSKEQSLEIEINDLSPGATALAEKQFFQPMNLINYHRLKMFLYGGNGIGIDDQIQFFLRWGSDTQNENYYEVQVPVQTGWSGNDIEVDFEDLSRLKVEMSAMGVDTLREEQENGHWISVVGEPSLTNVRWLMIGIVNNREIESFTGSIWIDELRLSDVRKDKGMAMRVSGDLRLSDFISVNGEYNRKDADFHTVNERFGQGSNSRGGSVNASLALHKLLPAGWGFLIPVSASYQSSVQTPKYMPGSDILITENTTPDTLLRQVQTINHSQGFNISLSRKTKSRNALMRYLVDPIKTSFNYTKTDMSNSQTAYSKSLNYKGSFGYSLTFGKQNYVQPLKFVGKTGFAKKVADTRLYYLPTSLSFDVRGTDSNRDSKTRSGLTQPDVKSNFTRGYATGIQPIQAISLDYKRSESMDMREAKWKDLLTEWEPGELISVDQSINASLQPKFFSWLSHSYRYNVSYRWNDNLQMKEQGTGTSSSVSTSTSINGTFDPGKLVQSFRKKGSSRRRTPKRQVRQPAKKETKDGEDKKKEKPENKEKKPFPLLSIFKYMGDVLSKIEPIKITQTQTQSANHYAILGTPSLSYQLGFTMDPGVAISENVTSDRASTRNENRISLDSGLKLSSQITVSLSYDFSDSKSQTTQATGTVAKSALMLKDNTMPFPNWNLSWRGLEKLPLLNKVARSVSLQHGFSGKQTITWNNTRDDTTSITTTKDFRPLISINMNFKSGLTMDFKYTTTENLAVKTTLGGGKTKQLSENISLSAKYSKRGGLKIPFLKGKKLDNNIDFTLTFTKSANTTLSAKEGGNFQETAKTENWSFQPRISYTFTKTVTGGCYLELGERKDKRVGNTKITAFGINTNISLSGG